MANKDDVLELNEIMSRRTFAEVLVGSIAYVLGNMISIKFSRKGAVHFPADRWAQAQLVIKTGINAGLSYHIDTSLEYTTGDLYVNLTPGYDVTDLKSGDRVHLEWDISKLPRAWWDAGNDIIGSNLSAKTPGSTDIPADFQGTLHRCLALNQELPDGCTVEDGDGIPAVNEHVITADNKELYVVEKASGYTTPIRPLHEDIFDRYGLSKDPADITVTDEPVTDKARRGLRDAEEKNLPTYEVEGQTLTNPKYEA